MDPNIILDNNCNFNQNFMNNPFRILFPQNYEEYIKNANEMGNVAFKQNPDSIVNLNLANNSGNGINYNNQLINNNNEHELGMQGLNIQNLQNVQYANYVRKNEYFFKYFKLFLYYRVIQYQKCRSGQ